MIAKGDVMESIVKQSLLYDFYGELLTEHQRSIYEDVVYNDMSLKLRLQKRTGSAVRGVHDLIKRCDKTLSAYEDKLHLISKFRPHAAWWRRSIKRPEFSKKQKDESLIDQIEQISNDIMEL